MRRLGLLVLMIGIWTCSDSGPTAPKVQLPTVQNIEFTLEEDTSKTFAFMGSDPLNRALTYSVSTQPQHGTITINAGAGTYTPNANYHGADSFAYIASNVDGSSNIGTIVATVTPVDDEPSTMDVSATTDEDNSVTLTLEAEEVDGENIEFQVRNNPSNGSVTISGNTATYTPNQDWYGTDTFNFEAVDSSARSILNTATATITVNPVNDAPVVEDITDLSVSINRKITIELSGTDIENEDLSFSIVQNPTLGTISLSNNIITFTGTSEGEDTFTYQASDGTDNSNIGTVSIEVRNNILMMPLTDGRDSTDENGWEIIETSNGDFAIAGHKRPIGGEENYFFIRVDSQGNEIARKHITNLKAANSIVETNSGNFIITATDAIIGVDEVGELLWQIDNLRYVFTTTKLSDGNYIIAGSIGSGNEKIIKVDENGSIIWDKRNMLGGYGVYNAASKQDAFFLTSYRRDEISLAKFDNDGNLLWNKSFANFSLETIRDMSITSSGDILISGKSTQYNSNGLGLPTVWKMDDSGEIIWAKSYEHENSVNSDAQSVVELSNGNIAFASENAAYLLDQEGDLLTRYLLFDNTTWNGQYTTFPWSIIESSDERLIMTGTFYGDETNYNETILLGIIVP
jgi:hypothetical protein